MILSLSLAFGHMHKKLLAFGYPHKKFSVTIEDSCKLLCLALRGNITISVFCNIAWLFSLSFDLAFSLMKHELV